METKRASNNNMRILSDSELDSSSKKLSNCCDKGVLWSTLRVDSVSIARYVCRPITSLSATGVSGDVNLIVGKLILDEDKN